MIRWGYCAAVVLLTAGCHQQAGRPDAPAGNSAKAAAPGTATILTNIDTADTKEDAGYAVPGESLAQEAGQATLGKAAPNATMQTIDGDTIDLARIYGKKPVYIKFWATWCVPCRQQMPAFEKLYETMGDRMELIAIDIGLNDDIASIRGFRQKYGLKMPIVLDDGRLGTLFHLRVTPQHVLIGKDVRFDYIGHADNAELAQAIHQATTDGPAAGTIATATNVAAVQVVTPGQSLPAISVRTTAGAMVPLKAKPGRLLAVELFSSWCEWYLKTNRPEASATCARARIAIAGMAQNDHGIDWLGIAGGPWATAGDLHDYQTKNGVTIPLALDQSNRIFRLLGVNDIPAIALIDPAGRLIKLIGPHDPDFARSIRAAQHAFQPGTRS